MAETAEALDAQFEQVLSQITVLALSQPRPVQLRIKAWIVKLREPTSHTVFKRNRNQYAALLLSQVQQAALGPPFTSAPPDGALPNLPQHLAYRARSGSVSPQARGRTRTARTKDQHHGLAPRQVQNLVGAFHNNMQERLSKLPGSNASQARSARGSSHHNLTSQPSMTSLVSSRSRGTAAGSARVKFSDKGSAGSTRAARQSAGRLQTEDSLPASASDDTHMNELLAAKETEIAARVEAMKQAQQLQQLRQERDEALARAEAAAASRQQRSAATKAALDDVMSRYGSSHQRWASPGGSVDGLAAGRLPSWAGVTSSDAPAAPAAPGLPAAASMPQPASPYAPLLADALSACGELQSYAAAFAAPAEAWHSGIDGNGAHAESAFGHSQAGAVAGQGVPAPRRGDLQQATSAWQRPPPSSPISAAVYGLGYGCSSSGAPGVRGGVQGVGRGLAGAAAVGSGGEGGVDGVSPQRSALRQVLLLQLQELQRETEQLKRRLMAEG